MADIRNQFLEACEIGDFETIEKIHITHGGYSNYRCPITLDNGLHKCARSKSEPESKVIAGKILKENPKLAVSLNSNNCTPLILSTYHQNEGVIQALLANITTQERLQLIDWSSNEVVIIDNDVVYLEGSTALHIAISVNNDHIVDMLLRAGAAFWVMDDSGSTALELAYRRKDTHPKIMCLFRERNMSYAHMLLDNHNLNKKTCILLDILLQSGLDINCKAPDGYTLLYRATKSKSISTVRFLISCGADVNIHVSHTNYPRRYENNMSALHLATKHLDLDIMNELLRAHANVNSREANGRTALHILCSKEHKDINTALICCELLIQNGCFVNLRSAAGLTPLLSLLNNGAKLPLAINIVSVGGDSSYVNTAYSKVRLKKLFKFTRGHESIYLNFMFESGFDFKDLLPEQSMTDVKLASIYDEFNHKHQAPRSLKRQAANVIRKALQPNARVGLIKLPLPPGFDKEYITLNARQVVSALVGNR